MDTTNQTLIDETMAETKFFAGACWPSADATRWALKQLAMKMADHVANVYETRKGPNVLRDELLQVCGVARRYKTGD